MHIEQTLRKCHWYKTDRIYEPKGRSFVRTTQLRPFASPVREHTKTPVAYWNLHKHGAQCVTIKGDHFESVSSGQNLLPPPTTFSPLSNRTRYIYDTTTLSLPLTIFLLFTSTLHSQISSTPVQCYKSKRGTLISHFRQASLCKDDLSIRCSDKVDTDVTKCTLMFQRPWQAENILWHATYSGKP
jgi:hypothetical protein